MEELNLSEFNPTEAELRQIVEITKSIEVTDLTDTSKLELVHSNRIALRDARVKIEKAGKALREKAVKFQKDVIARERELTSIIEPEEDRLKAIEDEAKKLAEREKRKELLPARRKMLEPFSVNPTDDELLAMDGTEFQSYCNRLMAEKNERERQENERKAAELRAEQDKLEREKEMREREEKVRQEERQRAQREADEAKAQREKEALDAEERAEREKADAEVRENEERERLSRDEKYQVFLKEYGYDGTTDFMIVRKGTEMYLYRKVGVYNDGTTH